MKLGTCAKLPEFGYQTGSDLENKSSFRNVIFYIISDG